MSCLGERVTALVDDRLGPGERHRALAHLSDCDACRVAVDAERRSKDLLRRVDTAGPGEALTARLMALAAPAAPSAAAPDPVSDPLVGPAPGQMAAFDRVFPDRPGGAGAATRPPGRPGTHPTRPRSGRRRSVVTAAAGGASVLGLSLMGVLALTAATPAGQAPVAPTVDAYAREHQATTRAVTVGGSALSPSAWTGSTSLTQNVARLDAGSGVVGPGAIRAGVIGPGVTGTVPGSGR